MKKYGLLILLFACCKIYAQQPGIIWSQIFGGSEGSLLSDVKATPDGGFVALGYTASIDYDVDCTHWGSTDEWLLKFNSQHQIEWQQCFGGSNAEGTGLIGRINPTSDGGYIFATTTRSIDGEVIPGTHGTDDVWIVKTDSLGAIQWQRAFGGGNSDFINDIVATSDGGYVFTASNYSLDGDIPFHFGGFFFGNPDASVVKLDSAGNIVWNKVYGGTGEDQFNEIIELPDNSLALFGYTSSSDYDMDTISGIGSGWFMRISGDSGSILENKKIGNSSQWSFNCAIKDQNDNFWVFGNGNGDCLLIKLNNYGEILKGPYSYGGNGVDNGYAGLLDSQGRLVISVNTNSTVGQSQQHYGQYDEWVVIIDTVDFNILQQITLGGTGDENPFRGLSNWNGNYLLAGTTGSDDGNVPSQPGLFDGWIVEINPDSLTGINRPLFEKPNVKITPNPTVDFLNISSNRAALLIRFYSITGALMKEVEVGSKHFIIDVSTWAQGFYLYEALDRNNELITYGKIIIQ